MMFGYGYGNMLYQWGWLGMFFMMLIPVAVIIGVVYLIYKAVDRRPGSGQLLGGPKDPLVTLKERYAKGEISQEDYKQIKEDILKD